VASINQGGSRARDPRRAVSAPRPRPPAKSHEHPPQPGNGAGDRIFPPSLFGMTIQTWPLRAGSEEAAGAREGMIVSTFRSHGLNPHQLNQRLSACVAVPAFCDSFGAGAGLYGCMSEAARGCYYQRLGRSSNRLRTRLRLGRCLGRPSGGAMPLPEPCCARGWGIGAVGALPQRERAEGRGPRRKSSLAPETPTGSPFADRGRSERRQHERRRGAEDEPVGRDRYRNQENER
jgi:hypothetical protein